MSGRIARGTVAASLLALAALVALAALSAAAVEGDAPPSGPGAAWVVDTDTRVTHTELALSGDVLVKDGCGLTLDDVWLTMEGGGERTVTVEPGATLLVRGCVLSAAEGTTYGFQLLGQGTFEASDVSGMTGGIQARSHGLLVRGCHIQHCTGAAL